jgi:hypothetical protein
MKSAPKLIYSQTLRPIILHISSKYCNRVHTKAEPYFSRTFKDFFNMNFKDFLRAKQKIPIVGVLFCTPYTHTKIIFRNVMEIIASLHGDDKK